MKISKLAIIALLTSNAFTGAWAQTKSLSNKQLAQCYALSQELGNELNAKKWGDQLKAKIRKSQPKLTEAQVQNEAIEQIKDETLEMSRKEIDTPEQYSKIYKSYCK